MRFFRCAICGKEIIFIKETSTPTICCGQPMNELIPGAVDGALEKHVPVIEQEGNIVTVMIGSVEHPMIPEHHIEWILLETNKGFYKRDLLVTDKPVAVFTLTEGEEVVAAYELCNLHGLWKAN